MKQKDINIEGFIFHVEYEETEPDHIVGYPGGEIEINAIYYGHDDMYPVFDNLGKLDEIERLIID